MKIRHPKSHGAHPFSRKLPSHARASRRDGRVDLSGDLARSETAARRPTRPTGAGLQVNALRTTLDPRAEDYAENRAVMLERLERLQRELAVARSGGGERYVERHLARGKLPGASGSSCCSTATRRSSSSRPLAGWGTEYHARRRPRHRHRPWSTASSASSSPTTRRSRAARRTRSRCARPLRAMEIARENRLPLDQPHRVGRRRPAEPGRDLRPRRRAPSATSRSCSAERHPDRSASSSAPRPPAARTCPA